MAAAGPNAHFLAMTKKTSMAARLMGRLILTCGVGAVVTARGMCSAVVLHPAGDIAVQQRDMILVSTLLMLIVIVPVMAQTVLFAWRYRQSNRTAAYDLEAHGVEFITGTAARC